MTQEYLENTVARKLTILISHMSPGKAYYVQHHNFTVIDVQAWLLEIYRTTPNHTAYWLNVMRTANKIWEQARR